MKRLLAVIAISLAMAGTAFAGGSPNMKPGLWEITTQAKMQGMTLPPTTITQCITKDDMVPRGDTQTQDCEVSDVKTSGDTVTWTMRCSGEGGDVESTGRITYHGDRFEGSMTTIIKEQGMTMESTMSGRRIGDCQ